MFEAEAWLRCRLEQVVVSSQLGCWFLHKKGQCLPQGPHGGLASLCEVQVTLGKAMARTTLAGLLSPPVLLPSSCIHVFCNASFKDICAQVWGGGAQQDVGLKLGKRQSRHSPSCSPLPSLGVRSPEVSSVSEHVASSRATEGSHSLIKLTSSKIRQIHF